MLRSTNTMRGSIEVYDMGNMGSPYALVQLLGKRGGDQGYTSMTVEQIGLFILGLTEIHDSMISVQTKAGRPPQE